MIHQYGQNEIPVMSLLAAVALLKVVQSTQLCFGHFILFYFILAFFCLIEGMTFTLFLILYIGFRARYLTINLR